VNQQFCLVVAAACLGPSNGTTWKMKYKNSAALCVDFISPCSEPISIGDVIPSQELKQFFAGGKI